MCGGGGGAIFQLVSNFLPALDVIASPKVKITKEVKLSKFSLNKIVPEELVFFPHSVTNSERSVHIFHSPNFLPP